MCLKNLKITGGGLLFYKITQNKIGVKA